MQVKQRCSMLCIKRSATISLPKPDGIHTIIGTKGVYLSGGEQQRIAIARVILKNSPIVILDEATAFADPENEVLVQKAFAELSKDKTVIMIAHRLTAVREQIKYSF